MGILETIRNPQDLSKLSEAQLDQLAAEVREFLIGNVSQTGGHLGPNLGVVELTIAVHRIFDSPRDSIVFDTGHQSYVHKLLTGRQDFSTLRQQGGLSGYPDRAESEHDIVESSHASSSLSWADGISRARQLTGDGDRYVIAVVGRRRPDRRHGLGGHQQHRRGQEAPRRDRRQRQRPLLRPDRRRIRGLPRLAAPHHRFLPRRARPTKAPWTGGGGSCRTADPRASSPTAACTP